MNVAVPKPKLTTTTLYLVLFVLVCCLIGSLSFLSKPDVVWPYAVAQGLFLLLGFFNVQPMRQYLPVSRSGGVWMGLLITLGLTLLAGLAVAALIHFLNPAGDWGFATAAIPLIIGYLFFLVYDFYLRIPPPEYKKWYYPVNGTAPDMDLIDLSRVLVIQFEFAKQVQDTTLTNFKAKAPVNMTLGELFLVFLNDYNERTPESPITYPTPQGTPDGWLFYKKHPWYKRRRYLDPDRTFQQNAIVDNDTLIGQRA